MWSKPFKPALSEEEVRFYDDLTLKRVANVVLRKLTSKVYEKKNRISAEITESIRRQKLDPDGAIADAQWGKEYIESISAAALRDTFRLFNGTLTDLTAELVYRDRRIFEVKVPAHLIPVLTANGVTRNVCLVHYLVDITSHVDCDIALDMARGFRTIGPSPKTGLWPERDLTQCEAKNVEEFFSLSHALRSEPSSLEADICDHIIDEIEADILRGRYKEISADALKVRPMVAFGVRQRGKIRTIIDERVKNSYSTLTEKLVLKGI
jgi:hypothetical protein